ncbi:MAG: hypothetical protein C0623_06370 [Desulfuromonas sp.]|nr:MAG: hypothetical protein C0623_06370 [Desulfuromonas sp.]
MLEKVEKAMFEPHLGELFQLGSDDAALLQVKLVEVNSLGSKPQENELREPFSLVFKDEQEESLPQGIYALNHEKLGQLDIFLVPIGPAREDGFLYEAVFA